MKTNESARSAKCQRCGAPIEFQADYPPVCDECYPIYGSCCNEWGNADNPDSD
ncbi:MAG: hypothetical protein HOL92_10895 [Opitutales bacterium]|nr:hypothetical protein [Opitutales bacterium]MDG2254773.1 hypothetical protein [Opitutaceae bacterium]